MTEGTPSPGALLRARTIAYASALAVLNEAVGQFSDLIRRQASEFDRLTSRPIDVGAAVLAWELATTSASDALARLEAAHAAFSALAPDAIRLLREAEDPTIAAGGAGA